MDRGPNIVSNGSPVIIRSAAVHQGLIPNGCIPSSIDIVKQGFCSNPCIIYTAEDGAHMIIVKRRIADGNKGSGGGIRAQCSRPDGYVVTARSVQNPGRPANK